MDKKEKFMSMSAGKTGQFVARQWNEHRLARMAQWLLFSGVLYGIALCCKMPLVAQAAITKAANVNAGAFLGYWIDRNLFTGFDRKSDLNPEEVSDVARAARLLCRGLIVGACILGLSTGVGA